MESCNLSLKWTRLLLGSIYYISYKHFEQSCCVWCSNKERRESSIPKTAYTSHFSCSSELAGDGDNTVCSHGLRPHVDTYASMRILNGKKALNWTGMDSLQMLIHVPASYYAKYVLEHILTPFGT